ncbi:multidrug effflux MFS transporter [Kordiimonas sp. SCSIO 12610]|uniref:multidrug effflux MFS transporter n=1 Tax=Kordiimonas sp. SCSIO 12610 TaxID=2829597 RepID=UPI00210EF48E|nr:multidrug effflux MFS transporter [Kordiimonas sp. SCSIO 12610]UTW54919.1 multidrug effflux MFS transporter [Kordiimonas sp. SCSIO 12610]
MNDTKNNTLLMPAVCGLICLTALAVDLSLPAIPLITKHFSVPQGYGQYVISIFVLGYAIGQLFWGAFSDMLGRRKVLIVGLALFVIIGTLSALAQNFEQLIALRFLHGVSAGVGPVIGRAIVRDISDGNETVRLMALVTSILGLAPLFAPLMGSGIIAISTWDYTFHAVSAFAVILFLSVLFFVPETNRPERGLSGFSWGFVGKLYKTACDIVGNKHNIISCMLVAVPFGGYYAILTGSPAVLNDVFGYNETLFGPLFAIVAVFWFLGATFSRKYTGRLGIGKLKRMASFLLLLAGVSVFASAYFTLPFYVFWASCALYIAGVGIMIPVATAAALAPFPEAAGAAAALLGLIQMGLGALTAVVVGLMYDGDTGSMAMAMLALSIVVMVLYMMDGFVSETQDS